MEQLTNIGNWLLATVNGVPPEAWTVLVETIVAALLASPLVAGIKKWFQVHSDKVMLFVTILASIGGAVAAYLVNDPTFTAWWVPVHGWLIFATTQPVYRYLIKPIGNRIRAEIDKAIELEKLKKSAVVPPSGLPRPDDFGS